MQFRDLKINRLVQRRGENPFTYSPESGRILAKTHCIDSVPKLEYLWCADAICVLKKLETSSEISEASVDAFKYFEFAYLDIKTIKLVQFRHLFGY